MKQFASKNGADLIRIIKHTSYSTPTEYFQNTTSLEREFLVEAVKQYEQENMERESEKLKALAKMLSP